jgi:hypothetical protein
MNNSLIFIFLLLTGISCSEPDNQEEIEAIYSSLTSQKHFHYNVAYSINRPQNQFFPLFYGLVSLNRNSDSGISSAYFGLEPKKLPHYMNSIYLQDNWVHEMSSNLFDLEGVYVLTDSLHSPLLLNPEILFQMEADSDEITKEMIKKGTVKWTFHLKHKPNQLVMTWDHEHEKLTELEYKYNVTSDNAYSRKWEFNYLSKSDYNVLSDTYRSQNQIARQAFL